MTYTLHNRLGSGGFAVEATLALADIDFAYDPIASKPSTSLDGAAAHLNPWDQVPVLVTPEGETVTETAAILIHLVSTEEACRAGPHLWNPNPPTFLRWSVFMGANIYEGTLRWCYPARFAEPYAADEPDAEAMNAALRARVVSAARARNQQAFGVLERLLETQPFLLGDRLSACDIFLAMLHAWHRRQPELPNCARVTERVATHALINPIWERNFGDRLRERWQDSGPHWS